MIIQLLLNGVVASCYFLLIAVGFSVIYGTTRFFHFAHGVVFTAGAYFTFLCKVWLGLPFFLSILVGIILCTLLGCLTEVFLYRPLRRNGASSMVLLVTSLGAYIVLQNIISMIFGDDTKTFRSGAVEEGINIFGARVTFVQILIVCVSIVLVATVAVLLKKTKIGKSMRAVANNSELANISGIGGDRVILGTFALGSALAGIAGILIALDVDMTPTMGMNALMMGVVAVIIGGVGSIPGIALGALLLGMAQHLGVWKIGSQWQDAIAFVILLIFLLFRPQGFLGKKIKKVSM
ncbi:MAG: branched-chain amino acid ABC transporter permease [Deltaproteobacteria bacterium]|nr:branched-chain amino acid ABC transporter permease [Deltaproteobacteria bacterium]